MTLTGGYMYTATDVSSTQDLKYDECLSRTDVDGNFHYQSFSSCISLYQQNKVPLLCEESPNCRQDSKNNTGNGIIGIAEDGHLVYGLYNQENELWDCSQYDECNGSTL